MFSNAFAQSAGSSAGGFSIGGLIPFILIFVIFYFLLIRPQQKRVKEHKLMVQNLKRGDSIVTAGGIVGKIVKSTENSEVLINIDAFTKNDIKDVKKLVLELHQGKKRKIEL